MSSGTNEKIEKALLDIPSEVEIEQLALAAQSDNSNPVDVHAQFFALYSPLIKTQLALMGKKQIIKLVSSIIEFPLNEKEIRLRTKKEQNVFKMVDQLLQSKYFMNIVAYMENQSKIEQAEKDGQKEAEEILNNQKGENNG